MPFLWNTSFVRKKHTRGYHEPLIYGVTDRSNLHLVFIFGGGLICVLLIAMSVVFWRVSEANIDRLSEERFAREVEDIAQVMHEKFDEQIEVLYGMRGILLVSDQIEDFEWDLMVQEMNFEEQYPAIISVAFLENEFPIGLEELFDKEEELNGNYIIKYVEPFIGNEELVGKRMNKNDWGLDDIRDKGELASIGRVQFGDTEENYIFLLPLYRKDLSQSQLHEKSDSHLGFLIAVIQPSVLLKALEFIDNEKHNQFSIQLSDVAGDLLINRSIPEDFSVGNDAHRISWSSQIRSNGTQWTLRVSGPDNYGLGVTEARMPIFILFGGIGFSVLIFVILYLAASSRMHALRLARKMTAELGKFKLAVRHASNHIIITNTDGKIIYANLAAEKMTGYSREEMLGNTPRLWGGQMLPEYYNEMWKVVKNDKRPFNGEIINQRKDGTKYDALVHISPIIDKYDQIFGFVGIEEDITTAKRLSKARSEFVSLVSHQLRTPLTAMRLTIETLMNGVVGPVDKVQKEMLRRSMEYAVHMSETIYTMLTISHLEAGKINVTQEHIDLCEQLNTLSREYEPEYSRKQQSVIFNCPENLQLKSDLKLLKEILGNLFSNAIKYTPDGGKVTITVKTEDNRVRIDFADNGMGIPIGEQERIFQKFFRAENIVKKDTSGTGLGLYLVQSLTKLLGGSITFVSTENKGTTFSLFLPLSHSTNV
ncbi:MAG: PAS domain-containing protein [Kiritimatiellales bacterium]|nr:PAS domain-containing protein [Kiritimatiellales bacterium]